MIYHYEKSVKTLCEFVGVSAKQHKYPKKYFNPAISIKNTKFWERYSQYDEAIKIIEKELPDFLYKY